MYNIQFYEQICIGKQLLYFLYETKYQTIGQDGEKQSGIHWVYLDQNWSYEYWHIAWNLF